MAGRARLKAAVPRPPPSSSPIGSGLFCLGSSSPGPAMALLPPALLPVAEMLRPLPLTPLVRRFGLQGADSDGPRTVGCGRPAEGRRWHGDRPQEAGQGGRKFPRSEQCRTPPRPRADRGARPLPCSQPGRCRSRTSLLELGARGRRSARGRSHRCSGVGGPASAETMPSTLHSAFSLCVTLTSLVPLSYIRQG